MKEKEEAVSALEAKKKQQRATKHCRAHSSYLGGGTAEVYSEDSALQSEYTTQTNYSSVRSAARSKKAISSKSFTPIMTRSISVKSRGGELSGRVKDIGWAMRPTEVNPYDPKGAAPHLPLSQFRPHARLKENPLIRRSLSRGWPSFPKLMKSESGLGTAKAAEGREARKSLCLQLDARKK